MLRLNVLVAVSGSRLAKVFQLLLNALLLPHRTKSQGYLAARNAPLLEELFNWKKRLYRWNTT